MPFENDVKTYGTETQHMAIQPHPVFENDVKTYGTETMMRTYRTQEGLRMM